MSLRPSGCGGRTDAVPPHVEKRRRHSRPSSLIIAGPLGAPSVGEEERRWGAAGKTGCSQESVGSSSLSWSASDNNKNTDMELKVKQQCFSAFDQGLPPYSNALRSVTEREQVLHSQ